MTITAKYASTCSACRQAITPGQPIEWERGVKSVRHTDCSAASRPAQIPRRETRRQITVERVGRRSYLRGDTLVVRGYLRTQGCHWDAEAKAWWIGSDDEAQRIATSALTQPVEAASTQRITHCLGCGASLDDYQQQHGYKFCSQDCVHDHRLGGQSGYVNGQWHQGSDD